MVEMDITNICVILTSQIEVFDKLIELENKKTYILEHNQDSELDQLMNDEQALIMESNATEKKRVAFCSKLGISTIGELIEKYPEYVKQIAPLKEKISQQIDTLKKLGTINARMLEIKLSLIKFMNTCLDENNENIVYGKKK